ncbi:MAG: ATPase, T2SS/T4P/T4SS family [Anaerolineae bacterium]
MHFEHVARRVADLGRRTLKGNKPYVLVDLPDGSRFTAIVPPLSVRGTAINIRAFNRSTFSLQDLAERGTFSLPDEEEERKTSGVDIETLPPVAQLLRRVAERNAATVIVSGEFGSGKTTLLNAMSQHIPDRVQVAVVETFEELRIQHPAALRVVVPEGRENFPSMDEVLNVVVTRMRPDLLVVGEVVREEAARYLDAINLGKKAWTTIHGNSALGALYRLETKALLSGLPHNAVREQIAFGVDMVVHMRKSRGGKRFIGEIALLDGLEEGRYRLRYLLSDGVIDEALLQFLMEEW